MDTTTVLLLCASVGFAICTGQDEWKTKDNSVHLEEDIYVKNTRRPRTCQDILELGSIYESHYVIYPEPSAPNKVTMIYCSQEDGMEALPSKIASKEPAHNCMDLLQNGMITSGPYIIYPYLHHPSDPVLVLCDQESDGGGWTFIHKRFDGSQEFFLPWTDYVDGFGNIGEEHYLGNNNIVALTDQVVNELMVELEDWDGSTAYAHYEFFHLDARYNYQIQVFSYDGTAGDDLDYHNGQPFSTFDVNNAYSNNCAESYHGAWWYWNCEYSNLNGRYYPSNDTSHNDGMHWTKFGGRSNSLKKASMKVRPFY